MAAKVIGQPQNKSNVLRNSATNLKQLTGFEHVQAYCDYDVQTCNGKVKFGLLAV